jgi:uncharacterized protein
MGDPVVHFAVGAVDDEPLVRFYGELFGWKPQPIPGASYTVLDTQSGGGINGGIGKSQTGRPWSSFYVAVDDPQAVLDKAESLGAKTAVPVTEIPGMVTFAMFDDPDGLLIGVVKSEQPQEGRPQGPSPGHGAAVDWFEVLGSDAKRTQAFYSELFGWDVDDSGFPGYALVATGSGHGIQGGLGASEEYRWATIYANVPDVEETLARVTERGGERIYGPMAVGDEMQTGAFRDPAGNVFGVYHRG